MSTHQIHVFISHAWAHSTHYETLANWIFEKKWRAGQAALNFRDFSIPKDNPIHNAPTSKALKEAIFNRISRSHVIVIPTGMYASHSHWIQKEIECANSYLKPILAVIPRGQEKKSGVVLDNAYQDVGWTKESVIKGIWELYRSTEIVA